MMLSRTGAALLTGLIITGIGGCASDHSPAPVTLLDSQETPQDFHYSADTYIVKRGDTLFAIAWYAGMDYQDIARYNKLSKPYNIAPGQQLRLTAPMVARTTSKPETVEKKQTSGTTNHPWSKSSIDRKKDRAYRESESSVKRNEVNTVKKTTKSAKKPSKNGFPSRIDQWVWPSNGRLTGKFNRNESGRKGIEVRADRGSPVLAAAAGKVVYAGSGLRGYGNLIIIKHTDSFLSAYAHNDEIAVSEQQWVKAGQRIASMGNSGTDYVKLHFEVRYRGKSLDPLRYLPER